MKKQTPLRWLVRRVRKRLPEMMLMTVSNIAYALLGVTFALGTRRVIDSAISGTAEAFLRACLLQGLIILGLLLCQGLNHHLKEHTAMHLDRDWKQHLLRDLFASDYAKTARFHSGELLNRLNNDVRIVNDGILAVLPNVTYLVTKLAAAFLVLSTLAPWFALAIFCAGVFVIILTGILRRRLKQLNKQVAQEEGRVSGFLQEALEKLLMVQAMDVAGEMEVRSTQLLDQRLRVQRRRKNISLFANTSVSVLHYAAGFAALVWCSGGLLRGTISFGTLTAVTQLVNQLQNPIISLSGVIPKYIGLLASAERLMELEDLAPRDPVEPMPREALEGAEELLAEDLSFSYDREQILKDASFTLPLGTFAVITGPSGTGKSTLLKLMLGIFQPSGGGLYLRRGENMVPLSRATRRAFAYVPQGNLLLSGTIRENLVIANPDATEAEIRQATFVSAMDEYLPQLPLGLDTPLGESGAGLSEGQAQRLALARGILSGAPILLLDESTSALDGETERKVLERIRNLPGRSCIIVTHRSAAVELCDWNLEIRDGRVTAHKIRQEG